MEEKGKEREIATTNCSQSYLLKGIKGLDVEACAGLRGCWTCVGAYMHLK